MPHKKTEPMLEVKSGDTRPTLTDTLEDTDGNPVDLTDAAEVRFYLEHKSSGDLIVNQAATILQPEAGEVAYEFQSGDTARTGRHHGEWVVTFGDGDVQTFPPDRFLYVDIEDPLSRETDPAELDPEDATVGTITADSITGGVTGGRLITNLIGDGMEVDDDGNLNATGGGGGGYETVVIISFDTTANDGEYLLVDASDGSVTVTLPPPEGGARVGLERTDDSANTVMIAANAGESVNYGSEEDLVAQGESIDLLSDGADWYVI